MASMPSEMRGAVSTQSVSVQARGVSSRPSGAPQDRGAGSVYMCEQSPACLWPTDKARIPERVSGGTGAKLGPLPPALGSFSDSHDKGLRH